LALEPENHYLGPHPNEELNQLLEVLPAEVAKTLRVRDDLDTLLEVVLDLGTPMVSVVIAASEDAQGTIYDSWGTAAAKLEVVGIDCLRIDAACTDAFCLDGPRLDVARHGKILAQYALCITSVSTGNEQVAAANTQVQVARFLFCEFNAQLL